MAFQALIPLALGAASHFLNKKDSVSQEPLLTEDQKQALSLLTNFGKTGRISDFQAGQPADLSGFNFDPTAIENIGTSSLRDLVSGGKPQAISGAQGVLSRFANAQFNPDDPSSGLSSFKRQLTRQIGDASDVLDREAAITGSRFGTAIGRNKVDLAERQSDIIGSKLAELFNAQEGRALQAAGGLADLGFAEENLNQNRIASAFQLGSLQRDLKNQEAQLAYEDFNRARNERLQSVNALSTVAGTPGNFGVKTLEFNRPSPLNDLLKIASGVAGNKLGSKIASAF